MPPKRSNNNSEKEELNESASLDYSSSDESINTSYSSNNGSLFEQSFDDEEQDQKNKAKQDKAIKEISASCSEALGEFKNGDTQDFQRRNDFCKAVKAAFKENRKEYPAVENKMASKIIIEDVFKNNDIIKEDLSKEDIQTIVANVHNKKYYEEYCFNHNMRELFETMGKVDTDLKTVFGKKTEEESEDYKKEKEKIHQLYLLYLTMLNIHETLTNEKTENHHLESIAKTYNFHRSFQIETAHKKTAESLHDQFKSQIYLFQVAIVINKSTDLRGSKVETFQSAKDRGAKVETFTWKQVYEILEEYYEFPLSTSSYGGLSTLKVLDGIISGRSDFSNFVKGLLRVKPKENRRHIIAWHTIRAFMTIVIKENTIDFEWLKTLIEKLLNNEINSSSLENSIGVYRQCIRQLYKRNNKLPKIEKKTPIEKKHLQRLYAEESDKISDAIWELILFAMFGNPKNLWVGNGTVNQVINTVANTIQKRLNKVTNFQAMKLCLIEWQAKSQSFDYSEIYRTGLRLAVDTGVYCLYKNINPKSCDEQMIGDGVLTKEAENTNTTTREHKINFEKINWPELEKKVQDDHINSFKKEINIRLIDTYGIDILYECDYKVNEAEAQEKILRKNLAYQNRFIKIEELIKKEIIFFRKNIDNLNNCEERTERLKLEEDLYKEIENNGDFSECKDLKEKFLEKKKREKINDQFYKLKSTVLIIIETIEADGKNLKDNTLKKGEVKKAIDFLMSYDYDLNRN